ncbi:MAG: hypothetical protein ABIP51_20610 [Bacteroidia bacterium]
MTKDKKIKNLREATKTFRGVSLDITKLKNNSTGIFRSRFNLNGVTYSLGYHATAVDAAMAVNKKAKNLFRSEKAAKAAGYWNVI